MTRARVLCVDDERHVLDGLKLHLRRFDLHTAESGALGLETLRSHGPFAVVVSDMRMPGMDGATFLAHVREEAPETVRMLLTGHSEMQAAIDAVNRGQIFRFLTKPCPPNLLEDAVRAGVEQHRLVTSERVLLEETLRGSIRALTDVLALTNPTAFGRANRIKQHVNELAEAVDLPERWQAEVAAMLAPLGCITLPESTVEKMYHGEQLDAGEQELVDRLPEIVRSLLGHIPRLEPVIDILLNERTSLRDRPHKVPPAARILRIATDYEDLISRGHSAEHALGAMRSRDGMYDEALLGAFIELKHANGAAEEVLELPASAVAVGMVLADDIKMTNGALFAARGLEVTEGFVERLRHVERGILVEPVRVLRQASGADAEQSTPTAAGAR